jgi:hypothetical protein
MEEPVKEMSPVKERSPEKEYKVSLDRRNYMDLSRDVMLYPEGWWRDTGAD